MLQSAVAALEEDTGNPNGPARGNYRVTPIVLDNWEPYPSSWRQLVASLADLEVDLISLHGPMVRALAELAKTEPPVLLPLDRSVGFDDALLLQEFYPYLLDPFRYEGTLYALPVNAMPLMLYYDARYFADAGVPPVDASWTWDTLVESAMALTVRAEDGATAHWGLEAHRYGLWWALWQNAALFHDFETGEWRLQEPAASEALQFYSDLLHCQRVAPPLVREDVAKLYTVTANAWPAMFYSPRQDLWNGDYRWATLPQGKVRSVPVFSDMSIAIMDWTENLEPALTALKGLVGIMQQFVSVPAKKDAVDRLSSYRRNLRPPEVAAVQASMEHGRMLPQGAAAPDGMPALAQGLMRGDASTQLTHAAAPWLDRMVEALIRGERVGTVSSGNCAN